MQGRLLQERPRTHLVGVVDSIFGFDFFISYAHFDGASYAEALANRSGRMDRR
jgi:hypothetical protein